MSVIPVQYRIKSFVMLNILPLYIRHSVYQLFAFIIQRHKNLHMIPILNKTTLDKY